jgi:transcriptional regulator with XRE-family HTH domain
MAHPLDVLVGQRLRQRRWLLGVTTQQLGEGVGITSQQIEEYENGTNRIGASRIWEIAAALDVPVMFFFEGLDGQPSNKGETGDGLFTVKEMLGLKRA